jgi:DNA polymerase-3 subunit delta'
LLVSHSPGRLLPTIRSRCRRLVLAPLPPAVAAGLIRRHRPQLDEVEAASLAVLCGGGVGRAIELADGGGLALYGSLLELLSAMPRLDSFRLHGLADRLSRSDAQDAYRATEELLAQFFARLAAAAARRRLGPEPISEGEFVAGEGAAMQALGARADAARWAELGGEIERQFATARDLNLDRKQTLLGAFFAIAAAAR